MAYLGKFGHIASGLSALRSLVESAEMVSIEISSLNVVKREKTCQ